MIKICHGIPKHYKGMGWTSQLQKIGISVQQIFNPFNMHFGLNYKRKDKSMSVIFDAKTPEDTGCRIIRQFEIDEFQIPKELSPYSGYLDGEKQSKLEIEK